MKLPFDVHCAIQERGATKEPLDNVAKETTHANDPDATQAYPDSMLEATVPLSPPPSLLEGPTVSAHVTEEDETKKVGAIEKVAGSCILSSPNHILYVRLCVCVCRQYCFVVVILLICLA